MKSDVKWHTYEQFVLQAQSLKAKRQEEADRVKLSEGKSAEELDKLSCTGWTRSLPLRDLLLLLLLPFAVERAGDRREGLLSH